MIIMSTLVYFFCCDAKKFNYTHLKITRNENALLFFSLKLSSSYDQTKNQGWRNHILIIGKTKVPNQTDFKDTKKYI